MTRRKIDLEIHGSGPARPAWLDVYESWHPLHFTAHDVYKEEWLAQQARRYAIARKPLAAAYASLQRFEDASLPQRTRVAAGNRAADQFCEAANLATERKMLLEGRLFGDEAVAMVSVNGRLTAALIATRFPRTIIDRQMARQIGGRLIGRRGSLQFRGQQLRGDHAAVTISFGGRSVEVIAFVPKSRFAVGFLVGADWVERTGVKMVDGAILKPSRRRAAGARSPLLLQTT